jgi:hypothetical protein
VVKSSTLVINCWISILAKLLSSSTCIVFFFFFKF